VVSDRQAETLSAMADLVTPMAIRVAATLRLADRLDRPRTAAELADEVGADPDALARLMRHLAAAGLLRRDDNGGFLPTELGACLRDTHPAGLRAAWDIDGPVGRGDLSLAALLHSVRAGAPAFPEVFGKPYWADLTATRRGPRRSTPGAAGPPRPKRRLWRPRTTGERSATSWTWAAGTGRC
jgi:2,7-dihydroxy-5-methyl-1-naphthoate 7-O-methyltransferase